ncbi:MAG TPA: YvcK family protein [Cerasibacillus sp.]|uniref:gluconeogenesis factor YvcK family protein n=1 Tax=Cerasibacillus sp. TaxID=2498711 RepID=UPI002F415E16
MNTIQDKPRIVVIGGGTGMPVLLRGLKNMPIDLTALVTVADDGGSTGRLRQEIDMPAPGDIRNVIAAMSDVEPILIDLFQHRFSIENGLSGHSMGNLLLAAMASVTGDFYTGVKELSRAFGVKGKIYPISNENLQLHAEMADGTIISGESNIPLARKKIERVYLTPEHAQPFPHAIEAIEQADLVVISPGSLYTSILPNLIIPRIDQALQKTKAKVAYVCNVMTQLGETTNYTAADHAQAIIDHVGDNCLDAIIVHNESISDKMRQRYAIEQAAPVALDRNRLIDMGIEVIEGDIITNQYKTIRHDTEKISTLLYSLVVQ